MADFAKVIRASDGEQVLFYKGQNDDGDPTLFQLTELEGLNAAFNLSFKDDSWDALDSAFEKAGVEQANAMRAISKKFLAGEPEEAQAE